MELNMETTENEIELENETTEEKKPRAPRTTTYYGFNAEEQLVTFQGTRDQAKDWSEGNLLSSGTTTMAFFRQRSNWWVLLTGEGGGEHQVDGTVPEAVEAAFAATGGKPAKAGGKHGRKRSKVKFTAETKLERHVLRWAKDAGSEDESGTLGVFTVLHNKGCSELVEHLKETKDALKFYKKYRIEINMLIMDAMREGLIKTAADLEGWDAKDPLAQGTANQTTLAHFGFEVAARNICARAGV